MMTQCRENSLTSWMPWRSVGISQRCTSWGEARWRQPCGPVLWESEGESALTLEMKGMTEVRTWADIEVLPGTLVVTVNALSLPGEGASPAEVQGWMLSFWNHVLVVIWKLFGVLNSHLSFWTLKFNIMQLNQMMVSGSWVVTPSLAAWLWISSQLNTIASEQGVTEEHIGLEDDAWASEMTCCLAHLLFMLENQSHPSS